MVEEHNTKLGVALRERRRIAEQLRRSQERYRALVETAFAGISMTDSDERLTFVNPGICEMLSYEADELQGKSLSELTDPDEFQRYAEYTQRRQEGLRNYYRDVHLPQKRVPAKHIDIGISTHSSGRQFRRYHRCHHRYHGAASG